MLITRRMNCIDAASGIVTLTKWPSRAQVERELQFPLNLCSGGTLVKVMSYKSEGRWFDPRWYH